MYLRKYERNHNSVRNFTIFSHPFSIGEYLPFILERPEFNFTQQIARNRPKACIQNIINTISLYYFCGLIIPQQCEFHCMRSVEHTARIYNSFRHEH